METFKRNNWIYNYVRFWEEQEVVTRFLHSEFMGHATTQDLHDKLAPILAKLSQQKLLQLSMDGPNVNIKLRKLLEEDIRRSTAVRMLDTGTCGLRILHNSFHSGYTAARWGLESLLRAAFILFDNSPARRQDFLEVTEATSFPLQYCSHRWLENVAPAERLLELLPQLKAFCSAAKSKSITEPTNQSFKDVMTALGDPLLKAKVQFFVCIAREIEPFLKLYQTDRPMMPFLASNLACLLKDLMARFVKLEVLAGCKSVLSLCSLEYADKKNHLDFSKVDVGFAATQSLREKNGSSDKARHTFYMECRDFLMAIVTKIMEKAPIKYQLVRNLAWMNPKELLTEEGLPANLKQLELSLRIMCNAGRVKEANCDLIKTQFRRFRESVLSGNTELFRNFDPSKDRVDELLCKNLSGQKVFSLLWDVVQQLLILSHGQATVERGFSINKVTMVENLKKRSLVARRLVIDEVRRVGGPEKVQITKEMLTYVSSSRSRYHAYLEAEKEKQATQMKAQKRKAATEEVEQLKAKRQRLQQDIDGLEAAAAAKADEAERLNALSLLSQSNALRRRAAEKKVEAASVDKDIAEKSQALQP